MSLLRCFSTLGCPELSLDETLALAAKHELAAVELRALGGTVDLAEHFAAEFGAPTALAERLEGQPVRIVALDTSLHLTDATDTVRATLALLAPWADALGVKWLRVFDSDRAVDAHELDEVAETIRCWRKLRRQNRWRADVMIETHDSLVTAEAIQRFLAAVPRTAILWDSHHTWKKGGEDPIVTWQAIRNDVVHIHVKDSVSVATGRHPFTYVNPGAGEFPMAPLRAALRASRFAGPVSLEWEKLWHPHLGPLDEALAAARRHAWW